MSCMTTELLEDTRLHLGRVRRGRGEHLATTTDHNVNQLFRTISSRAYVNIYNCILPCRKDKGRHWEGATSQGHPHSVKYLLITGRKYIGWRDEILQAQHSDIRVAWYSIQVSSNTTTESQSVSVIPHISRAKFAALSADSTEYFTSHPVIVRPRVSESTLTCLAAWLVHDRGGNW
jgi:hypothetical protein